MRAVRCAHVVITGPDLVPVVGGIQTHVAQLRMAYGSLGIPTRFVPTAGTSHGSPVVRKLWKLPGRIVRLWLSLRCAKLVHVNSTLDLVSLGRDSLLVTVIQMRRVPVVVQFHGGSVSRLGRGGPSALGRLLLRRVVARADVCLFLSQQQLDEVGRVVQLESRTMVVNNFVVEDHGASRALVDPPVRILFLGRLTEDKGFAAVLQLAERLQDGRGQLLVAGAGPLLGQVQGLAERGYPIRHCGVVSGEEKWALIRSCDLVILPSRDEVLPYALVESVACGLGVIATDVGVVNRIVEDGGNGRLVDVGDSETFISVVLEVLDDPRLIERMKGRSLELYRQRFGMAAAQACLTDVIGAVTS